MTDYQKLKFYNPALGNIKFSEVIEEVFKYIKESPEKFYEIVVGCDSSSDINPAFPVALVILRKGNGGRFFLTKMKYPKSEKKKFYDFHQRILQEVLFSCELALEFREIIKKRVEGSKLNLKYQFEYIHADVGESGRTKDMIKEVVGLIKSNGFTAKIKPESFAASIVADRFT
jgi:predicted RNase H-related nuclease YkuK (DUF458 family)